MFRDIPIWEAREEPLRLHSVRPETIRPGKRRKERGAKKVKWEE
jgi:hypothetical protein